MTVTWKEISSPSFENSRIATFLLNDWTKQKPVGEKQRDQDPAVNIFLKQNSNSLIKKPIIESRRPRANEN